MQITDTKTLAALGQVGVGFIPTLAAAGHLLCILPVAGRTGINPIPTADACNALAIDELLKLLQHSVGVGVIPTLAAAWHLLFPDFVTFLLRPNTFLDNHTLIAFTHCRGGLHALP